MEVSMKLILSDRSDPDVVGELNPCTDIELGVTQSSFLVAAVESDSSEGLQSRKNQEVYRAALE